MNIHVYLYAVGLRPECNVLFSSGGISILNDQRDSMSEPRRLAGDGYRGAVFVKRQRVLTTGIRAA